MSVLEIAAAAIVVVAVVSIAGSVAQAAGALVRLADLTAGELNTRNMERAEASNAAVSHLEDRR